MATSDTSTVASWRDLPHAPLIHQLIQELGTLPQKRRNYSPDIKFNKVYPPIRGFIFLSVYNDFKISMYTGTQSMGNRFIHFPFEALVSANPANLFASPYQLDLVLNLQELFDAKSR